MALHFETAKIEIEKRGGCGMIFFSEPGFTAEDGPEVRDYIRDQREHHRAKTFEAEYKALLDRHEIPYDERYVFDSEIVG